jgi:hypothetical protein
MSLPSLTPAFVASTVSAKRIFAVLASLATATLVLTAATPAEATTGRAGTLAQNRTTSTRWLLGTWAAASRVSGSGPLGSPQGRQLVAALQAGPRSVAPAARLPAAPGGRFPTCQGTWLSSGAATVHVQQSTASVPWGVLLTPLSSRLGVVRFQAQIYAGGYQANVYQPHVQGWSYQFHGYVPRTFSVVGAGVPHTMHPGTVVSFLWYWNSVTQPGSGGYAYLNCTYLQ